MTSNNKFFSVLQNVGRSFMLPIALLPIAGLLLGIGASFTNPQMLSSMGLLNTMGEGTIWYSIFTLMSQVGNIVFANLPIIFALGVAIGMAVNEHAVAALSALIAFFVMHQTVSVLLGLNGIIDSLPLGTVSEVCGIKSLNMGVFGGIIVGLGVAYLHNKFYKIKLPDVISFFGGVRFVPIISSVVYMFVGILMYFIWPSVQNMMLWFSSLVVKSQSIGTFIYGVIERSLIPFGLHHVFYMPFWQTAMGGTMQIDGTTVSGAQNIFFAQLASPNTTKFSVDAARFFTGKFPFMIFGLPGAALAMYQTAKLNKKKAVGGLLLSAALTAMLTGITEPIEFTFLFVAPVLYAIHCVFAGLSFMLMHLLNVAVGMTFSGGIIDLILFGVIQGNSKTNWLMVLPVGLCYFVVYYLLFKFLIKKMNLMTPGREEDEVESKLFTRKDYDAAKSSNLSAVLVEGLGGADNIADIGCCATRLRLTVKDASKIDQKILKSANAAGVLVSGQGVQIIYGPKVTVIKSELEEYVDSLKAGNQNQ